MTVVERILDIETAPGPSDDLTLRRAMRWRTGWIVADSASVDLRAPRVFETLRDGVELLINTPSWQTPACSGN